MYREFDMEEEGGHVYDMSDIMVLKCESDAKLASFYHNWVNTILCLTEPIPDKSLEFLMYAQLEGSTVLQDIIGRYDRSKPKSSKRSYTFLKKQLERYLARVKKETTRQNVAKALSGNSLVIASPAKDASAAPAARAPSPGGPFLDKDGKHLPCKKFAAGTCEYGDKCRFSHGKGKGKPKDKGKPGSPPASPRLTPAEKAKKACPFHSTPKGCLKGDKCDFSHTIAAAVCLTLASMVCEPCAAVTIPAMMANFYSDFDFCVEGRKGMGTESLP